MTSDAVGPRMVVVGGSGAGLRAAQVALKAGARVEVVSADPDAPFYRPALSKQLLSGEWTVDHGRQPMPSDPHLRWHGGVRATAVDTTTRTVALEGGEFLDFDALLIATGCRPRRVPGIDFGGRIFDATRVSEVLRIRDVLGADRRRIVIVGAGLIGSEVAAVLNALGHRVTVVDPAEEPLRRALGPLGNEFCLSWHRRNGVELMLGTGVTAVTEADDGVRVDLTSGDRLTADAVVSCVGVVPDTAWLADSGIPLAPSGLIEVGPDLMVSGVARIAAAGDAVQWRDRLTGRPRHVEHWLTAVEQGAAAAHNLLAADDERKPFGGLPTFWSEQHGQMIHLLGDASPDGSWHVEEGSIEESEFVAACAVDGDITGYLLVNSAKLLGRYRRELLSRDERVTL